MTSHRIEHHPILEIEHVHPVTFTWSGETLTARPGEMIASALFAHGIHVFGHHSKDGAPQGIFCANGQCSQCLVLADGVPVKACMTAVRAGMHVTPIDGLPPLPRVNTAPETQEPQTIETEVLILGGGPAGMSAAIELGDAGVSTLLVDDKDRLGGKLVLQTHRFFGSVEAVYAGTRGIDIAKKLDEQVRAQPSVDVWLNTTALAVYSDRKVGLLRGDRYVLVTPQVLLVATGARERSLIFRGNTLPGVYGAGAFQTLVNRDLVRAAERLFIVGGGNVGLIAGYHALQAGIKVVGLVEALPECGGYKVHADKLQRLGVPIFTSHTVVSANGEDHVASITIAQVDEDFAPISDTKRTFACDTILIAVGLNPVDEFTQKARAFGLPVFDAGDAQAIAEASAAMFTGRIAGRRAALALDRDVDIPEAWHEMADVLRSHPGATIERPLLERETGVFPVFHCNQEIPCNPCATACPRGLIEIPGDDIRHLPIFTGCPGERECIGCERCVVMCPGLAITLVDYREDPEHPTVSLPFELGAESLEVGDTVTVLDIGGQILGEVPVTRLRSTRQNDRTTVVRVKAPKSYAKAIAGLRPGPAIVEPTFPETVERLEDDDIVCRCERVKAGEIRARIREGYRDINELKAVTRAGMGACGGKTCTHLIHRIFREMGIPSEEVTEGTSRPLFVEVPLGRFAGARSEE